MISEAYGNDFGFTMVDENYIAKQYGLQPTTESEQLRRDIKILKEQYQKDLKALENLILPLLRNLLKNPEKEYILWKDREKPIQAQIAKILEITEKQV